MKPYRLAQHEKLSVLGDCNKPVWIRRSTMFLCPPVCWIYAEKGGGPVLVTETSWRKISGVQVHVGTWQAWLHWRRWK